MTVQCSVFIATSLDGFIARKDGGLDWLKTVEQPGEDYGYAEFAGSVDAIVMGRSTYDIVVGFDVWPYAGKRMFVLTHRPTTARHGEEMIAGTPADVVAKLEDEGVKRAYIDGGATIRQFLAAGLIDDITVSVIPILLGDGIPLFGGTEHPLALEAVEQWPTGLVQLRYQTKSRR